MIRVGLVDTGTAPAQGAAITAARSFTGLPTGPARHGHGARVAGIILHHAPDARLLDAQTFGPEARADAAAVAAALRWLIEERAQLVNLSLGLVRDRAVLQEAVAEALAAGLILIAALPARGGPVYPAAYPGVLRVTGDARCAPDELSALGGAPERYGACPRDLAGRPGGASLATARLTGLLAHGLRSSDGDVPSVLRSAVRFHGRERRRR